MIEQIQAERAFYFSYDVDLTKNFQKTFTEIQKGDGTAISVEEVM